jgi:hypothetical protein
MKNKKAAMEMSVGTIVTIVLLMTVLVLGLVLVRTIFTGAVKNIEGIDRAVEKEIQKLFSEDKSKTIVIIPSTRDVILQKGESSRGFGLSIRNLGEEDKFSYEVRAVETSCGMKLADAEDLISLGADRSNILIPAGNVMENPIFVKFNILETTPPCEITYTVTMENKQGAYGSPTDIQVTIESK